jgi:acetylornithine/succinyldiaminopimelate/putrescine aminotransferase
MNGGETKARVIQVFHDHVSSGKADFFKQFGMDFVMGRREGPYLWDLDDQKRLFNLHCNGGVFNLGHRHPEIVAALKQALDETDIGNHHLVSRERAELAQRLAGTMPGDLDYVVFGVGGGEAVDLAFKVARAYTGRSRIISARGGYHGHTGLALAAGDEKYRSPFGPSAPGFVQVAFGDIPALTQALDSDTAAVILETVPATLGMVVPPPGYLETVSRLCRERGALLILDEVQTGLGRTGRLWGFEHFNIQPDIVVIGKALSGGLYPISATVIRRPLEAVFHPDPFIHISTFGGSELGCRVAGRVLDITNTPEFLARVNLLAEKFAAGAQPLLDKHRGFFKGLRQLGLMMGLELEGDFSGPLMSKAAFDQDLLMVYANNDPSVIQFLPPLITDPDQVDWIMERLDRAMEAVRDFQKLL